MTAPDRRPIFRIRCSKCGYTSLTDNPNDERCTAQFGPDRIVCGGEFDDNGPRVDWWDLCSVLGIPTDSTLDTLRRSVGEVAVLQAAREWYEATPYVAGRQPKALALWQAVAGLVEAETPETPPAPETPEETPDG